jgi:phage-related protein
MKKWQIHYYTTEAGHIPVKDFIDALPTPAKAKTFRTFELVEEYGTMVGGPHVKHIDDDLWEIRVITAEGTYRFIFTLLKDQVIMLLHAFSKKTQKLPPNELKTAKARLREIR